MGLLNALTGAAGGVLADSWRDFFYCDSLPADVLARKGAKRVSSRGANRSGEDNIISDGSIVAVNEGQCMIIVESGKVVELSAEPGEFVYDASTEPSVFYGSLGESLMATFEQIGKRFAFGGSPGKDQRVYFFNTKEVVGNKYGTMAPVPFRVVDANIGLDVDIAVKCFGEYSYRLSDPMLFYKNVCGNVEGDYLRGQIDSQLKSDLLTALQPAFGKLSAMGIRYSAVPAHTLELSGALNELLSSNWSKLRGISIASFGVSSISARPEDEQLIKDLQKAAVLRDPTMAAASIAAAQSDAMRTAAANEGGAMMGFMGMGMANAIGGMNAKDLYGRGQAAPPRNAYGQAPSGGFAAGMAGQGAPAGAAGVAAAPSGAGAQGAAASWVCSCGQENAGRFCQNCGFPRPAPAAEWACGCGAVNSGRFCQNCGSPRP